MEGDGRVGIEPLVEGAGACGPLPAAAGFGLQHQFLAYGLGVLLLHHGVDVLFREVLVQVHVVVQELKARHAAQDEVVGLMLQVEAAVQQVAPVAALVVVGDAADVVGTVFLALGHSGIFIRVSALVGIFIVQSEIQLQVLLGQVDGTEAAAEFVVLVHALVQVRVLEEASLVFVEEVGGEGKLRADAVVVADAGLIVVVGGGTQCEVRSLVSERRFGKDTYQSAHRVASV